MMGYGGKILRTLFCRFFLRCVNGNIMGKGTQVTLVWYRMWFPYSVLIRMVLWWVVVKINLVCYYTIKPVFLNELVNFAPFQSYAI